MKKITVLLSLFLLTIISCTSSEEATQSQDSTFLPKKYIDSNGSTTTEFNVSYNNNKINEAVSSAGSKSVYTYTEDLITNVTVYRGTKVEISNDYSYNNGILKSNIKIVYDANSTVASKTKYEYTPKTDGSILEESYTVDVTNGTETKTEKSTVYTFSNDNLTKQIDTNIGSYFDGVKNVPTTTEYIYENEYDTQKSPETNILGITKIDFTSPTASRNNSIKRIISQKIITPTTTSTTILSTTDYSLSYDSMGYLTQKTSTYLDGNKTVTLKTQVYYN
ncbi:hypothetical protein [Flavobacterium algicola]|uniref:hypothetical protein n=1 Tax=Flavobacterium algicola TaxID=556529 RepID=UPI001EFDD90A|nr:hypothetical protein [Flavobacterium algicola]MCG9791565.1 hypothetical protein [Flavobacterium algicola]